MEGESKRGCARLKLCGLKVCERRQLLLYRGCARLKLCGLKVCARRQLHLYRGCARLKLCGHLLKASYTSRLRPHTLRPRRGCLLTHTSSSPSPSSPFHGRSASYSLSDAMRFMRLSGSKARDRATVSLYRASLSLYRASLSLF